MTTEWNAVRPELAPGLSDARLQLHHAAQLATALGISYLRPRDDDSHTNLEWLEEQGALASNPVNDARAALRVRDLTLLFGGGEYPLHGRTIADAAGWLREALARKGLDPARFTLARHYEIPAHPVAQGRPFDADATALQQLAAWFGNGAAVLERLKASEPRAGDVRCWPHHFDIATLVTVAPGRTVGIGLEPGDVYYDEPYFYVNMYPSPTAGSLNGLSLRGGGRWHTREWVGAVLPASGLTSDQTKQGAQVSDFLKGAVDTALRVVS